MSINSANSVLQEISNQGGVYMFGTFLPIWAVILIEFFCAYTLEIFVGSPMSFKIASKTFNMKTTNPVIFESVII